MKDKRMKLVENVIESQAEMNELTIDKINEVAPKAEELEPQTKLTAKEIASREGVQYIEPTRKLSAFGTLPEKLKKEHARDWEYVKGVFENNIINGEGISFWYSKYPGDPDCLWTIPANRPVYVPRMIATHLEHAMKYHTFDYIEKPDFRKKKDDHVDEFSVTGTHYRGTFRAIGAFK